MPTRNPRINITLEEQVNTLLELLAKQEQKSVSRLTKELILEALELREDRALSTLADVLDAKSKKTISHEKAWK